jgi:Zn-dependent protease/CBS domain-containing protein
MVVWGRSLRVGRIAGIPIGIQPLWVVIVALITWTLGSSYYPSQVHHLAPVSAYLLGLASALLLFASILAHELGHALVARRYGVEIEEIDLWMLGGVARMKGGPRHPSDELRYALAGPGVSAAIAVIFGAYALLLPPETPATLLALIEYQALINALILAFNLLPAFPLDGGRIARALMWRHWGDLRRATEKAAALGRGFGFVLIALGVLSTIGGAPSGLWMALIGVFVTAAARAELMHVELETRFSHVPAAELMTASPVTVREDVTVQEAVKTAFGPRGYTALPVVDPAGHWVGLLSLSQVARIRSSERGHRLAGDVADHDPALRITESDDILDLIENPSFARTGRAVVCDQTSVPVGIVSITDVQRAIRAANLVADGSDREPDVSDRPRQLDHTRPR